MKNMAGYPTEAHDVATDGLGCFIFSLDMELAWGYYDKFVPGLFSPDGSREREAVRRLLSLFDEYEIPATWAVVGQLFYRSHKEAAFNPAEDWKGKYPLFERMYYENHPLLFAPDILEMLLTSKIRQEIGFHGHTHKVFDEETMSPERAKSEIQAWKDAAKPVNIEPKTVIFPRSRVGYFNLFRQSGFTCYRGLERYPAKVYYLPVVGRFFRRFHYYLTAVTFPSRYSAEVDPSGLVNLRFSRWLFGFNRRLEVWLDRFNLHTLRLQTLVQGVRKVAEEKKILHVFAHPCEFKTERDFQKPRFLLCHVANEVQKGRMVSTSMEQMAEKVKSISREQP